MREGATMWVPLTGLLCTLSLTVPGVALADTAYVPNADDGTVTRVDTATNAVVGEPITVGAEPRGVVIARDRSRAYVANGDDDTVSVVDLATNTVVATVPTGDEPRGIAITPDGSRVYVVNVEDDTVTVIDTATTLEAPGSPIGVGDDPRGVAIRADGARAYVTNAEDDTVTVIDTATNTAVATVPVGSMPRGIAARPDGARVYVANSGSGDVSVIDTASNTSVGAPIPTGSEPRGIAFTPSGARAYVTNGFADTVSVIDTATEAVEGTPIAVGSRPDGIAITGDGSRAYVANTDDDTVSPIETTTNAAGAAVTVGGKPRALAILPALPKPEPTPSPTPAPSPTPTPTPTPAVVTAKPPPLILACQKTSIALVDVVRSGSRVRITGQAAPANAGKSVRLRLADRGRRAARPITVGRTTIRPDGTFAATVPRPARRFKVPEYLAQDDSGKSRALELDRRMLVDSIRRTGDRIRIVGHVTRPLPARGQRVVVTVQTDCKRRRVAGRGRLDRRGRFTITVAVPAGASEALYRAQTRVPLRPGRAAVFPTFTLPRPVALR